MVLFYSKSPYEHLCNKTLIQSYVLFIVGLQYTKNLFVLLDCLASDVKTKSIEIYYKISPIGKIIIQLQGVFVNMNNNIEFN